MTVKTDRKDARGLAQLIRMDWFRPVHAKSMGSQEVQACWLRASSLCNQDSEKEQMNRTTPSLLGNVITIDDERIKDHLDRVVRGDLSPETSSKNG
jgi:transposase